MAPGSERDDLGDLDDPQLAPLRSVWRSMRDEEPPARGLDALLAAARDKAEEMKPAPEVEPWWRRALASVRRPPVLALASVAVLLGGALVMTRHKDELVEEASITSRSAAPVANTPAEGGEPGEPSPAPAAAPATIATESEERGRYEAPPVDRPPRGSTESSRASSTGASRGASRGASAPAPATPPPPAPARREAAAKPAPAPAPAEPAYAELHVGEGAEPPRADPSTKDALVAGIQAREDAAREEPSLDTLIRRCAEAAASGDCDSVRSLASRIERVDSRAYRTRVLTQPEIRRCLSPDE